MEEEDEEEETERPWTRASVWDEDAATHVTQQPPKSTVN
jgi:hypothetical protein